MHLNEVKIVAQRAFTRTLFMMPLSIIISGVIRMLFQKEKTVGTFLMGAFSMPGLQIIFVVLFILFLLNFFSCMFAPDHQDVYDPDRNFTQAGEGVAGTAKEITNDREIASLYGIYDPNETCFNGHILGMAKKRPKTKIAGKLLIRDESIMAKKYLTNRNTIIMGSPGTGKSAGAMIPNIINSGDLGHSMVITDPKGELCDITYPYLKSIGYDVKVFNLVYPWASNGWNFMEWLSTLSDSDRDKWVNVISNIMIKNTSDGEGFWDSAVNMLLQALICLLLEVTERVEIDDHHLKNIQNEIDRLREERSNTMETAKIPSYNSKILEQMEKRKKYVKESIEKVKEMIRSIDKKDLSQRGNLKRLEQNFKKLMSYAADQDVIENYGDMQDGYEPITIYEAKKRVLNFGTCVDMLQLNVEETKDPIEVSAIESFNKMSLESKRLQFFYEALFKPSSEKKVYVALKQMFAMCDLNKSLAYRHYNGFLKEAPPTVRSSCKGGLMIRMAPFNQKDIRKITETNEIDLEKLAKGKCVVYCIISDQDGALSFISSIFITLAFQILQTYADSQPNRKLPARSMFYLDEISNVGVIPDFTRKLTTLRSRDIHAVLGVQSYPQLLQRYETDEYCMEIFGACDLMMFCGCGNETMTPKFISELIGEMTVKTEQERETQNRFLPLPDAKIMKGESLTKRALFTPDEIATMDFEDILIIYRGTRPIKVNRKMWFNYPYAKKLNKLIESMPRISGSLKESQKPLSLKDLLNGYPKEETVSQSEEIRTETPFAENEREKDVLPPAVETPEREDKKDTPKTPKKEIAKKSARPNVNKKPSHDGSVTPKLKNKRSQEEMLSAVTAEQMEQEEKNKSKAKTKDEITEVVNETCNKQQEPEYQDYLQVEDELPFRSQQPSLSIGKVQADIEPDVPNDISVVPLSIDGNVNDECEAYSISSIKESKNVDVPQEVNITKLRKKAQPKDI